MVFCPAFEVFLVTFFFARSPYPIVVILEILVLVHAILVRVLLAIAQVIVIIFLVIDPFSETSEFPGNAIAFSITAFLAVPLAPG